MSLSPTRESAPDTPTPMRTRRSTVCWLCGSGGQSLYSDLHDHLFGVPGSWSLRRCDNRACRMVWLDPLPVEEDIHHAYRDYHTHTAGAGTAEARRGIRRAVRSGYLQGALGYHQGTGASWLRHLRVLAHLYPTGAAGIQAETMFLPAPRFPARLLDVGCGNGDLLLRMRSLGWTVEGVDMDPAAVQAASTRGLEVRQGELPRQQYPPHTFDAVTMCHLIEHVHDPLKLLGEAGRILKPGGTLVILTPNSQSLGARVYGQDWRGWEPPRHLHIFNLDNLRATLERADLSRVRVTTVARGARDILASSAELRHRRRAGVDVAVESAGPGRVARLALQLGARFLTAVSRRAGEEILAVARTTG